MSYAIARRVHHLERELAALTNVFDSLTPQGHRALIDAWALSLIRADLVPAPDPEHPTASIESLRHTHREELEQLRQTVLSSNWQKAHRATAMALFLRALQRVARVKNG